MDFVEWCDSILGKIIEEDDHSDLGFVDDYSVIQAIFGPEIANRSGFSSSNEANCVFDATQQLAVLGLINSEHGRVYRLTNLGRFHAKNKIPLWSQICAIELDDGEKELLAIVNRLGVRPDQNFAEINWVSQNKIISAQNQPQTASRIQKYAQRLKDRGLLEATFTLGPNTEAHPTYAGLTWEFRRAFTIEAQFIGNLVNEWETTSVDFKRELHLDTNEQKVRFIKDLLSLATTQASGRRWLIIGFDDKTREFVGFSDPKITQNRIEQIIADNIEPSLAIRYETVDYLTGKIGKLEVLREAIKLPYRVKRSLNGEKSKLEQGQIYVRHGSQVEFPSSSELQALTVEAQRAQNGS